jgi:hypothetical protein
MSRKGEEMTIEKRTQEETIRIQQEAINKLIEEIKYLKKVTPYTLLEDRFNNKVDELSKKLEQLENRFQDHRHMNGLTCPERDELIKKLEQLDKRSFALGDAWKAGIDSKLSSVATDLDDLTRRHNELIEKVDKLHLCASAKEWSWMQSKVDRLESKFNDHINPEVLLPRFKTELLKCLEDQEFKSKLWLILIEEHSNVMLKPIADFMLPKADANKTIEKSAEFDSRLNQINAAFNPDVNNRIKLKSAEDKLEEVIEGLIPRWNGNSFTITTFGLDCLMSTYQNWKSLRKGD